MDDGTGILAIFHIGQPVLCGFPDAREEDRIVADRVALGPDVEMMRPPAAGLGQPLGPVSGGQKRVVEMRGHFGIDAEAAPVSTRSVTSSGEGQDQGQ